MRRKGVSIVFILFAVLLATSFVSAGFFQDIFDFFKPKQQPQLAPNQLVALYPFEGNANDFSGNGNHGTVIGATLTSGRFTGQAYQFDGNDYIIIPDDDTIDFNNEFTLSGWFYFEGEIRTATLIAKEEGSVEQYRLEVLDVGQFPAPQGALIISVNDGGFNGAVYGVNPALTGLENQWVNIIAIYDGVSLKLYINGVELPSNSGSPFNGNVVNTNARLRIGASPDGSNGFIGKIDDVRLYNYAIPMGECTIDLDCGFPTSESICVENSVITTTTVPTCIEGSCVDMTFQTPPDDCGIGSTCVDGSCIGISICGNNIIEPGEVCDGNSQACENGQGYSGSQECNAQCNGFGACISTEFCGDDIENGLETCDDGVNNGQPGMCNLTCDGIVPLPCTLTSAYWSTSSTIEGAIVSLTVNGDSCHGKSVNFEIFEDDSPLPDSIDDPSLIDPSNGVFVGLTATTTWIAEWQCDGNIGGVCTFGGPEYYFNAILISNPEENKRSSPPLTVIEFPPTCGNGLIQNPESCDDGIGGSQFCSTSCTLTTCGDNVIQNPNGEGVNEQCDNDNLGGDTCTTLGFTGGALGCTNSCGFDTSTCTNFICGNNILEGNEQCDDGNIISGDGCSNSCTIEEVCGNGILEAGEECDDGNNINGDGCSNSCTIELQVCGNGILESGEECDDGNDNDFDFCTNNCIVTFCGDGICNNDETTTTCEEDCGLPPECTVDADCPTQTADFCSEDEKACISTTLYNCEAGNCVEGLTSFACTLPCENGCFEGNCLPSGNECENGCEWRNGCIPYGIRVAIHTNKSALYCDVTGQLAIQRANDKICLNNYECLSDFCSEGRCANPERPGQAAEQIQSVASERSFPVRLFRAMSCWFKHPVSRTARQMCLIG